MNKFESFIKDAVKNTEELNAQTISETMEIERGNNLIAVLHLKLKKNGRVDTAWGDKTPLGLFRTVNRIVNGEVA